MEKEIRLCADGKYRWVYELHVLKNPTMFLNLLKAMAFAMVVIFLLLVLVDAFRGELDGQRFLDTLKFSCLGMVVFLVLDVLTMLVAAVIYHGKYVVLFEMDDKMVNHIQMPRQVEKNQVVGMINVLVGAVTLNPTEVGVGLMAGSSIASATEYAKVRRVKAFRRRNLIQVNQRLFRNQIYVPDEDFDFVYDYIVSHCPNLK
ncbi:MAG: hypothetical protein J6X40_01440 [Bacteroidales bacterium]|nr:hypothetical protein [Bacteroidales bacterium]